MNRIFDSKLGSNVSPGVEGNLHKDDGDGYNGQHDAWKVTYLLIF